MTMSEAKKVLIVHAVDTEGPLYESLDAKFERLEELFKISGVKRTPENLQKLQNREINLGGLEEKVAEVLKGHRVNYNDSWEKIDEMLERISAPDFRNKMTDSYGRGWVFNWHCLDHVGFEVNPRRRDMGYHNVQDHYERFLARNPELKDAIHWHFHPMSTFREAHRCATSYVNSDHLYTSLCRKIIERNFFPTVFRAGFQTERPDSHLFLEQWIPFDISNMALDDNEELNDTIDFRNGRSGDWRLAPSDWSVYHPHHDNYQLEGNCRRWIGRALNVFNRLANINEYEMEKAFKRADSGKPTLVGIASHDFRDLEPEVDYIRELVQKASKKYPDVNYKFCEAVEGFRETIWPEGYDDEVLDLEMSFHPETEEDVPSLEVSTKSGEVFGPQPFLAIQTRMQSFIHDNFDFDTSLNRWYYAFHVDSIPLESVDSVGVAANDKYGNVSIKKIRFDQKSVEPVKPE